MWVDIGALVRRVRLLEGKSQPELAKENNVSTSVIYQWEKAAIDDSYLVNVASLTNLSVDSIQRLKMGIEVTDAKEAQTIKDWFKPINDLDVFYFNLENRYREQRREPDKRTLNRIRQRVNVTLLDAIEMADEANADLWAMLLEDE